jgi:hypothetical protein
MGIIDYAAKILATLRRWFPIAFANLTGEETAEYTEMIVRMVRQSCRSILALDVTPVEISFWRNYDGVKFRLIDRLDEEGKEDAIRRLDMFGDILLAGIQIIPGAVMLAWGKWSSPDGR